MVWVSYSVSVVKTISKLLLQQEQIYQFKRYQILQYQFRVTGKVIFLTNQNFLELVMVTRRLQHSMWVIIALWIKIQISRLSNSQSQMVFLLTLDMFLLCLVDQL